ncbi:MAG TPA: TlpA disulfide reductase family protein [Acidimicrobiales bacterium]
MEAGEREAPSFALPGLVDEGDVVRLSDHRGSPVVLNFWASWCAPCRREMPALAQVSAELDGRVSFIGIDHQDRREEALALLRQTGVRYPTAFDPTGGTAQDYGLRGMPTTVFIDADGRVLATSLGELTESELRTSILELFDVAAN